jgi:MGT family glycosyltransferase
MKNAHISFVSAPIASHLNPVLPIASALIRRGHRVSYAVCDPFAARVEQLGAEVIKYRFGALTFRVLQEDSFCTLATRTLAAVMPFYEKHTPDLIVYDLTALAGRVLAHRFQVPAVKTTPHFAFTGATLATQICDPMRAGVLESSAGADRFLQRHGIFTDGFIFHRERLNIHMMPREYEPCDEAIDETCLYAGRCAGEQTAFGNWSRGDRDGKPVVLVATSRSYAQGPAYFRMCLDAFAGMPWHVVLSVDGDANAAALLPLPENAEIVQNTSHTRILPRASLLAFMGGMTTANEAAYHGVPWVCTSLGISELEWLAENLARLRIGVHLKGAKVSPSDLRQAALQVLESSEIRDQVRHFQRSVQSQPGGEEAASRIEECLTTRDQGWRSNTRS